MQTELFDEKTPTFKDSQDSHKPAITEVHGQSLLEQLETGQYVRREIERTIEHSLSSFRTLLVASVAILVVAFSVMTLYLSARISDVASQTQISVQALSREIELVKQDVAELKKK